jgi:hypothetical protein
MRELLDEAIGVAPPTRIDVDATIARQRRILLLRPAGVLVAVVVVIAAIVFAGNGMVPPAAQRNAPAMSRPSSAATVPSRSPEPNDQVLRRQSTAINELLRVGLTGVTVSDRLTRAATVDVISGMDYPGYRAGAHMSIAVLTTAAGIGDFTFSADSRPGTGSSPLPSETAPEPGSCAEWRGKFEYRGPGSNTFDCTDSIGPEGETVLALSMHNGDLIVYAVLVWRPYSLVSVSVRNCWNGWDGKQPSAAYLPAPPLTLERITAIALDPRLAM